MDGSLKSESFVRCAFVVALGAPRGAPHYPVKP